MQDLAERERRYALRMHSFLLAAFVSFTASFATIATDASSVVASVTINAAAADEFPDDWFWRQGATGKSHKAMTGKAPPKLSLTEWRGEDEDLANIKDAKDVLGALKGKVVVVDFWATWCGPCLADIPKLKKIHEKYKADGFEILGLNAETIGDEDPDPAFAKEAAKRAIQIVTTRGVTWPQGNSATSLPVAVNNFGVKVLPTKILIGRDGKIIARLGEKYDTEKIVADAMAAKP